MEGNRHCALAGLLLIVFALAGCGDANSAAPHPDDAGFTALDTDGGFRPPGAPNRAKVSAAHPCSVWAAAACGACGADTDTCRRAQAETGVAHCLAMAADAAKSGVMCAAVCAGAPATVAVGGRCARLCDGSAACAPSEACRPVPGVPVLALRVCTAAQTGDEGAACDSAFDCGPGLGCVAHRRGGFCGRACDPGAPECPSGGRCSSTAHGDYCARPGEEGDLCGGSAQCAAGLICAAGVCRETCGEGAVWCADGRACVGGGEQRYCLPGGAVPVGGPCGSHGDCVLGALCVSASGVGACRQACVFDADCPKAHTCEWDGPAQQARFCVPEG